MFLELGLYKYTTQMKDAFIKGLSYLATNEKSMYAALLMIFTTPLDSLYVSSAWAANEVAGVLTCARRATIVITAKT